MKRRREITLETERIVIRGQLRGINWCEACQAGTPMVTAEQAASLIGEETDRFILQGRARSGARDPNGGGMLDLSEIALGCAPK